MLLLHAISGCDTVSGFNGVGTKTAWQIFMTMESIEPIFSRLENAPEAVTEEEFDIEIVIERFVFLLYSRTSTCKTVNEARKYLHVISVCNIPPSRTALVQHVK